MSKGETIKNTKSFPIFVNIAALFVVMVAAVFDRCGTYPYESGIPKANGGEWLGIILPVVIVLLLPVFANGLRQNYWTRTNLIITLAVILINLYFIILIAANRHYYLSLWNEANWDYAHSPRIIWNFWSIL